MDRGAWRATVRGVTESQTQLSDLAHTQVWDTPVKPHPLFRNFRQEAGINVYIKALSSIKDVCLAPPFSQEPEKKTVNIPSRPSTTSFLSLETLSFSFPC